MPDDTTPPEPTQPEPSPSPTPIPTAKEKIEQKIAAREAEVRAIADQFNVKQKEFIDAQKQAQEAFNKFGAEAQIRVSNLEGMVLQLREDLKELEAG
jgi:uncharacterized protein (DUF305 family)